MLLPSDAPIPQNSLDSLPLDEQNWDDFETGRVLVSGIIARVDARCSAPASSFTEFGPVVESTVADALQAAQTNLSIQSTATQDVINTAAGSGAVISDDEISSAPNATTLGSTPSGTGGADTTPVYSPGQIAAATTSPRNWAQTQVFKPHPRSKYLTRSMQGVPIGGGAEYLAQGAAAGGRGGGRNAAGSMFPGAPWGKIAASPCGSSLDNNPWGKLFLFGGLGLIAMGLLNGKRR